MLAVNIEFGNCGIVIFTAYDRSWLIAVQENERGFVVIAQKTEAWESATEHR